MYTQIPYKLPKPIDTKVQAIRYLKKRNKNTAKFANDPSIVKYIMNKHKRFATKEIKVGIYTELYPEYSDLLNLHIELENINEYPELTSGSEFGVCDDITNFLEIFDRELSNSSNFYFVTFIQINKADQCSGWRWCKWGTYIGNQQPTCEYLYDEPIINEVMLYHIYQVLTDKSKQK